MGREQVLVAAKSRPHRSRKFALAFPGGVYQSLWLPSNLIHHPPGTFRIFRA